MAKVPLAPCVNIGTLVLISHHLHFSSLKLDYLPDLYHYSKSLADIVIPLVSQLSLFLTLNVKFAISTIYYLHKPSSQQEYGISKHDKTLISKQTCNRFYRKIHADLQYNVQQLEETVHRLDPRYFNNIIVLHLQRKIL